MTVPNNPDYLLSVQDVYNVLAEHLQKLDELWPDGDLAGPRKINVVELFDAVKLRMVQQAQKNADRFESPFLRAAKKVTGLTKDITRPKEDVRPAPETGKSAMQLSYEESRQRRERRRD